MRKTLALISSLTAVLIVVGVLASHGYWGERQLAGSVATQQRSDVPTAPVSAPLAGEKSILFGDLHVHTTYSFDAFSISLPMYQGEGAHPPADACDYARHCSALDFWSINDHAEGLTPAQWRETQQMVRDCNAVSANPQSPDMVTYLGWEWTQIGTTPDNHYGHKNVVLLDTDVDKVPVRPISSRQQLFPGGNNPYNAFMRLMFIAGAPGGNRQAYHDFARFLQDRDDLAACEQGPAVRDLPANCQESAPTPTELFGKLDDWGYPSMVIPHGNTWGFYTPPLTSWDKQLKSHSDPEKHESLIEVFSGHGNIEQYKPWRALDRDAQGELSCPPPGQNYTPECWQAGEIIRGRCLQEGLPEAECAKRAGVARANHVAADTAGHLTVPGAQVSAWLDSGQCRDCYMPAYNYRPMGSAQYALAIRNFDDEDNPKRFRFGLIGSSDVHTARPGNGYKEIHRRKSTDAAMGKMGPPAILNDADPVAQSRSLADIPAPANYFERFTSFFGAGGLVAAHSGGRDRQSIWDALDRKEVYATSGDRILLWFDLLEEDGSRIPMGADVVSNTKPNFKVRALGAFEQKPGCPADSQAALGQERLELLCGAECYNPSDVRKRIERIEVVRITPQNTADEPVDNLVQDPWLTLPCDDRGQGCEVEFSDSSFPEMQRDAVYYVRAIQSPTPTMNGDNLRCEYDDSGQCIAINPCSAANGVDAQDDCTVLASERAWSSPIFVDYVH